jgi:2-phosphosulfolactate phosphatase
VTEVDIHRGLTGVEKITGTVVVIDVFRASNTIISLLAVGAAEVFLVAALERARALKRTHPDRPLLGERGGVTPADFDGDNSPSAAGRLIGPGASPILTTSAGTRAVGRLSNADTVLFGSFANATAVARAIEEIGARPVTLLPMGLEAREPAVEDDEAALWIAHLVNGEPQDFRSVRRRLLDCDGARRLRRLGQIEDLELCTRLDTVPIVPVLVPGDPPRAVALRAVSREIG